MLKRELWRLWILSKEEFNLSSMVPHYRSQCKSQQLGNALFCNTFSTSSGPVGLSSEVLWCKWKKKTLDPSGDIDNNSWYLTTVPLQRSLQRSQQGNTDRSRVNLFNYPTQLYKKKKKVSLVLVFCSRLFDTEIQGSARASNFSSPTHHHKDPTLVRLYLAFPQPGQAAARRGQCWPSWKTGCWQSLLHRPKPRSLRWHCLG